MPHESKNYDRPVGQCSKSSCRVKGRSCSQASIVVLSAITYNQNGRRKLNASQNLRSVKLGSRVPKLGPSMERGLWSNVVNVGHGRSSCLSGDHRAWSTRGAPSPARVGKGTSSLVRSPQGHHGGRSSLAQGLGQYLGHGIGLVGLGACPKSALGGELCLLPSMS
jgi:hypothetical protein